MTLARSLWKNSPTDTTNWNERCEPFCTRCESRVLSCKLIGTDKQGSSCLLATDLDNTALLVIARLAVEKRATAGREADAHEA